MVKRCIGVLGAWVVAGGVFLFTRLCGTPGGQQPATPIATGRCHQCGRFARREAFFCDRCGSRPR